MTPLRLFQITDTSSRRPVPDLYFGDREQAKAKRRTLNGGAEREAAGHLQYVVSPGPDHRNYKH